MARWFPSRLRCCFLQCLLAVVVGTARGDLVRSPNSTLNLPADLPAATGYTASNALGGLTFNSPMCTTFPTGETNRLYVVQRGGTIRVVNNLSASPVAATFMDLATHLTAQGTPLSTDGESGLLSMVFHPRYNQNGYFYLYYSITVGGQLYQRLARFQATGTPGNYNAATSADPATQMPMLTMLDEASNHNGGDLAFGADGYLYLSLGDEGAGGDQFNNARFINKDFWGQMLRLDVDNNPANLAPNAHAAVHAGTYRVPADNPFIGYTSWHDQTIAANTVRTEIFATGFRNPFRYTIDPATGRIFLGDVGQNLYEEVDIVVKGGDYGWSWREGLHAYGSPPPPTAPPAGYAAFRRDPIFEYDHVNDGTGSDAAIFGTAVTGGMVYRGNQLPELYGKYLFGDSGQGIIAALSEDNAGLWTGKRITTVGSIVDFGVDPRNGEPLLCSLGGTIYKLTRSGTTGTAPPAKLSATGAFTDLTTLTPNSGIVAYEPNVDFWSDYAHKSRWFAIKNSSDTMTWSASGNWTFPTGMVWIKHFDFETTRGDPSTRRKLETRFLVKTASGVYGLSYRWRADQTDADLVAEEGLSEVLPSSSPAQTWRYPSRSECITCHSAVAGHALSFNTPQMNRAHEYGGTSQNQIEALSNAGYFSAPASGVGSLPAFARADDTSQSLEWRVRSYLAVNCAQCHQPGGASQGNWDARHTTPMESANIVNGLLVNEAGDSANRFVVPTDTGHSMLLKRQQGNGVPRMPPLATNERDLADEQLVTQWINALHAKASGTLAINLPAGSIITVNEEAGSVQIPIIRTDGADGDVGFSISTINGMAVAGADFTAPASPQSLGHGVTTMNVPISISDPINTSEPNETFAVTLSSPTGGATLGAVTSVTVRIIDSVDSTAPPAPSITKPLAGSFVGVDTGGTLDITGTASDGKGLGKVRVKLNGGAFMDAVLTTPGAASTNWSLAVTPVTGPNTTTVQSFDTRNNASTPATRTFVVTRPLAVAANSSLGNVTAGFSPSSFREVGKSYTITATPKPPTPASNPPFDGAIFTGWTITGATKAQTGIAEAAKSKQTITLIFREGMSLTANFISNPYVSSVVGAYNGLVKASAELPDRAPAGAGGPDGTAPSNSTEGYFTAAVQSTGAFSGKLTIDGLIIGVAGAFDELGRARFGTARTLTQAVARPNKPSLIVKLNIGGPSGSTALPGKITGQVTATDFKQSSIVAVSEVDVDRSYYSGLTAGLTVPDSYLTVTGSAPPPAGRSDGVFTVVLPPVDVSSQPARIADAFTEIDYPQGYGLGTIRVTKAGAVTLAGTLADGTAVSAAGTLSQDLQVVLFAQLYSLKGFLSAQVKLDSTEPDSDLKTAAGAELLWSRPFIGGSHYYPYGWPEVIRLGMMGAKYVVTAGQSVVKAPGGGALPGGDEDGNVTLSFGDGQLSEALFKAANVSAGDAVIKVPDNDPTFTLGINRATGAFSGIFEHTNDTRPGYSGIIYQKGEWTGGYGFFLTKQPLPIDYTGESGGSHSDRPTVRRHPRFRNGSARLDGFIAG